MLRYCFLALPGETVHAWRGAGNGRSLCLRTGTNATHRSQSGHLTHVKSAFDRLGYELADSAEDDWSVMWAFHSPFHQRKGEPDVPAIVRRMNEKQMVSRTP